MTVAPGTNENHPDVIEDEFILRFLTPRALSDFVRESRNYGVTVLDTIERWNSVRVRVTDKDAFDRLLRAADDVESEHNYYVRTPDVMEFLPPEETAKRSDPRQYYPFGSNALEWLGMMPDANRRGNGVLVAVLDTGVEAHSAFANGFLDRIRLVNEEDPNAGEYRGHATAVAAIISGDIPEIRGVAPDVDILSIQVLDGNGVGDAFTLAKGIIEAVDRGALIINVSLGTDGDSWVVRNAVEYSAANNVVIVAAVGNDGRSNILYPARYSSVVAVTSVDALGQHLPFANEGPEVDVAAPGYDVLTAWPGEQLAVLSGTSLAVPFVVGAVALFTPPDGNANDAVDLLLTNSKDAGNTGWDPEFGNGNANIGGMQRSGHPGYADMAITDHYIDPTQSNDNQLAVVVTAQNQGTEDLSSITLRVTVDGSSREIPFRDIPLGKSVSQLVLIDKQKLYTRGAVELQSSVAIVGADDKDARNNSKSTVILYEPPDDNRSN